MGKLIAAMVALHVGIVVHLAFEIDPVSWTLLPEFWLRLMTLKAVWAWASGLLAWVIFAVYYTCCVYLPKERERTDAVFIGRR